MAKAREMIGKAKSRIYLALVQITFPALRPALEEAIERGVRVVLYSTSKIGLPGCRVVVAHVSEETLQVGDYHENLGLRCGAIG